MNFSTTVVRTKAGYLGQVYFVPGGYVGDSSPGTYTVNGSSLVFTSGTVTSTKPASEIVWESKPKKTEEKARAAAKNAIAKVAKGLFEGR